MDQHPRSLRRLTAANLSAIAAVLADAFGSYPVMHYVLDRRSSTYARDLHTLVRFFATARLLRREPIIGAIQGNQLSGVALVSDPGGPPSPPELSDIREETWATLGTGARRRYETFGKASASVLIDRPHLHLNMIGVRAADRGKGLSRRLLDEVHRLAGEHPEAEGVSLTTEDPANLPLYEYFGYRSSGKARVSAELLSWAMFRPNSPEVRIAEGTGRP